jgi:hypothetical protein
MLRVVHDTSEELLRKKNGCDCRVSSSQWRHGCGCGCGCAQQQNTGMIVCYSSMLCTVYQDVCALTALSWSQPCSAQLSRAYTPCATFNVVIRLAASSFAHMQCIMPCTCCHSPLFPRLPWASWACAGSSWGRQPPCTPVGAYTQVRGVLVLGFNT